MTTQPTVSIPPPQRTPIHKWPGKILYWFAIVVGEFIINLMDLVMQPLQRLVGVRGMAYVFILPNMLVFSIFVLFPMMTNFVYTFTGSSALFLEDRPWVGTENIETLFNCDGSVLGIEVGGEDGVIGQDPLRCEEDRFARAVVNTAVFVVLQVGFMIGISLLTAVILNRKIRFRGFFRSVFFYPVLLSPIVVALIWRWILQENGLFNGILDGVGLDTVGFLTQANWARFWVIFISVWSLMGFYTLILLAGLQAIPLELYEAAEIDGASNWRKFRGITLPLLMPTMLVVIILASIRAVQVFDVVWAFTGGAPGSATLYIVQYIYENGFASATRRYGLAAATSLVMATALIAFTLFQLYINRRNALESAA